MRGWFGVPWWVFGAGALVLACVWVFVWPADRLDADAGALRWFFVRWGHMLTWLLLAASFFVRAWLPQAGGLANLLALTGLAFYIGFLTATFVVR